MGFILESNFWFAVLRSATPIIFATMAVLIATKSGVLNMSVEGTMLVSALAGVIGSAYSKSLLVGFLVALTTGVLYTMILAYCILKLKTNPVITGVALNLAATGGTVFILSTLCGDKTMSASLLSLGFPSVNIPIIKDIPFIGQILSGHNLLTYISLLFVVLVYILLSKTPLGIKIRAVGESEEAASSVGISGNKIKTIALLMSGTFAAFGGMYLSMGYLTMFTASMTAGRGYIALAANAMAGSNPIGGLLASLIYAFGDSVANFMQNSVEHIDLLKMMPYLFIIIVFVLFSYRNKIVNKEEVEI